LGAFAFQTSGQRMTNVNAEQAQRCRALFSEVVLTAIKDYARDGDDGVDAMKRWANSKDGQLVIMAAGIDHSPKVVTALTDKVRQLVEAAKKREAARKAAQKAAAIAAL
jgi:hypothetical protein